MRQRVGPIVEEFFAGVMCCLLACALGARLPRMRGDSPGQAARLHRCGAPGLSAGDEEKGADGRLYILASPSPGICWCSTQPGKQCLSTYDTRQAFAPNGTGQGHSLITFGEDIVTSGPTARFTVADRGGRISSRFFLGIGTPLRSIPVIKNPLAVAALPEGEVAVAARRFEEKRNAPG